MSNETCPAAVNLRGEHIPCDEKPGHSGWAHANREHQMIWKGNEVAPVTAMAEFGVVVVVTGASGD